MPHSGMDNYGDGHVDFDWNNITRFGISPGRFSRPRDSSFGARTLERIQVSPPPPMLKMLLIRDLAVTDRGLQFGIKYHDLLIPGSTMDDSVSISVKTGQDEWMFMPLAEYFTEPEIARMRQWVATAEDSLIKIGTEFEKHHRQTYYFLYEILALWHALGGADPEERVALLNDTDTALKLHHNRILAEVLSAYRQSRSCVKLHPRHNNRQPDLLVDGVFVDVKTVLMTGVDKRALLDDFARKIARDVVLDKRVSEQVGRNGTIIVGAWSSTINSILQAALDGGILRDGGFEYKTHAMMPPLHENKMIFSLPASEAFQNTYLELDRDDVAAAVNHLAQSALEKIDVARSNKYFLRSNMRKNCTYGISSDQPGMYFEMR